MTTSRFRVLSTAVLTALPALACDGGDSSSHGSNTGSGGTAGGSGTYCPPVTDVDEDGFDPIKCGGTDCDDLDPGLYPGSPIGFEITQVTSFAPLDPAWDLPEGRDVAVALDANGDIVIAFEGRDGVWFGRYSGGAWTVESVATAMSPHQADPSLVVLPTEIVIAFAQVDAESVPTLARYDGTSFTLEAVAEVGEPPVLAVAPDQTLWMTLQALEGTHPVFRLGPERDGAFVLAEVTTDDLFAPAGTRYQIDSAGHHHLVWGETANRTPAVKFWYATDSSGTFTVTEFSSQVFRDRAALLVDGSDVHIAYVRPRNAEGVYYKGPSDAAPLQVISDARGAFSDAPEDLGVALAVHEGVLRLAYVTDDALYLASRLTDGFSSTRVDGGMASGNFASPAMVAAPDGLHLVYFARARDGSGNLELKHARLPVGSPVGCQ